MEIMLQPLLWARQDSDHQLFRSIGIIYGVQFSYAYISIHVTCQSLENVAYIDISARETNTTEESEQAKKTTHTSKHQNTKESILQSPRWCTAWPQNPEHYSDVF